MIHFRLGVFRFISSWRGGLFLGLIASLALGLSHQLSGEAPAPSVPQKSDLDTYVKWHEACLNGGTEEIDTEIRKFEERLTLDPKDHLAQAFLGSACALRAKAGVWGPTKLKYLRRGRKLMESAVTSSPNDPLVRMIRAIAYYRIPKRFKVRPTALSDFDQLVPLAKNGRGQLRTNERQAILYYAWLAYQEDGRVEAAEVKMACHRLNPKSKYGKLTKSK